MPDNTEKATVYKGEARVAAWNKNDKGVFVRFELDLSELHPFDGEQGQRFMLVAVRIGNDELPCDNPPFEKPTEAPPLSKAKQRYAASDEGEKAVVRAGALAKDGRFYSWLIVSDKYCYDSGGSDEDWSAEYIRTYCGIASRSELATNKDALQKFLALEEEFKQWAGMTAERRE